MVEANQCILYTKRERHWFMFLLYTPVFTSYCGLLTWIFPEKDAYRNSEDHATVRCLKQKPTPFSFQPWIHCTDFIFSGVTVLLQHGFACECMWILFVLQINLTKTKSLTEYEYGTSGRCTLLGLPSYAWMFVISYFVSHNDLFFVWLVSCFFIGVFQWALL